MGKLTDAQLALLGDRAAQERITERGELLPCQCGGEVQIRGWFENHETPVYARCTQCGMHRGPHMTVKEAELDWNTRAPILTPNQIKKLEDESHA